MVDELRIAQRIDTLRRERDKYIVEAEKNLAAYNAVIAELEHLLQPEPQGEANAG